MLPFPLTGFPDIREEMIELRKVGGVTHHFGVTHSRWRRRSNGIYFIFGTVPLHHHGQLRKMSLVVSGALINSDLPGLKLISKGKVRDIYETSDPNRLLFVATDRISAYDVIMKNVRAPYTHPSAG